MLRPAIAQPCATAQHPNLVTQKTRFAIRSFVELPGLPKAYLNFTCPFSFSYARKKTAFGTLKQFWATVLLTKMKFQNSSIRVLAAG